MEVVLQYKNNCYRKTTINKNVKKKTNSYKRIKEFVHSLPEPVSIEMTSNLKLNYENGDCLILKDYKNVLIQERKKKFGFYSAIINNIKKNVPVTKKVNNINAKRIATMALTAVVFLSATGIIARSSSKSNGLNDIEIINVEEVQEQLPDFYEIGMNGSKESYLSEENVLDVEISVLDENVPIVETNVLEEDVPIIETNISEEDFNLFNRLEQTQDIYFGNKTNNVFFPICTKMDSYATNKIVKFLNSTEGQCFIEYGEQFGVDPYILIAISLTESSLNHSATLPGGNYYNGYAVGIMQHELPDNGRIIKAYNYSNQCEETIKMSMDKACDFDTNVKMGAMIIQNYIQKYNNNIYLALQAYNYGFPIMDKLINCYAKETNQTYEDVVNNYNDFGWMKYVQDMNQNPSKYLSNWQHKTYGNSQYISKVLGYYLGVQSRNILSDGTICYTNLLTMENVYENSNVKTI